MLHVSRTAAKALSVALAAGSIASARSGKIDINGDKIADIPLVSRETRFKCVPTLLGGSLSMTYSCPSGTNNELSEFFSWGGQPGAKFVTVRNNDPNSTSFGWAGGKGWQSIPVVYSSGSTMVRKNNIWSGWKPWNGSARKISGMFNGDQETDILYVKLSDDSATMAFGAGVGNFSSSDMRLPAEMAADLRRLGAKTLVGDVTKDGIDDIIILDTVTNMGYVGVAISQGGGTFSYKRSPAGLIPSKIAGSILQIIYGDFNGDGRKDLAITDQRDLQEIPVAYSTGTGTFNVVTTNVERMNYYATLDGARIVVGDFDKDGKDEFALAGGAGWRSIPVAKNNGTNTWTVTNNPIPGMTDGFGDPNGKLVVGDFNGDNMSDVAVVGATGDYVFVASSVGGGSFSHRSYYVPEFQNWASYSTAFPVIEER